jgi:hypothetical protein
LKVLKEWMKIHLITDLHFYQLGECKIPLTSMHKVRLHSSMFDNYHRECLQTSQYKLVEHSFENIPSSLIYVGDFNSHNQQWGYDHKDVNLIHEWMTLNSLHLIYHPKDKGTFRSARWNKDYTPDLSIVTRAAEDDITVCICVILDGFLKSQHRPVLLQYGRIPLTESVRIQPLIDAAVPVSQAGFWKNRSCTQQVMALTSHIETGFERKLKTGTIFIDLTAAYDTVWRDGLMLNFMRVVSCSKISRLLNNMLSNRYFQTNSFAECETTLEADLDKLDEFFRRWRLQPNPAFLAPHTKQTDCWT